MRALTRAIVFDSTLQNLESSDFADCLQVVRLGFAIRPSFAQKVAVLTLFISVEISGDSA